MTEMTIDRATVLIAGAVYGGVESGSEQLERCRDAARLVLVQNAAVSEPTKVGALGSAAAAEKRAKQFNATFPIGTDGFVKDTFGDKRVLVRVDGQALVYPHPFLGEVVMAWLHPVGWRNIMDFEPKHKDPNKDALELCAAAAKLSQEQRHKMAEHLYYAALRADPTYWRAMNDLGVLCHQDGRYDEAVAHFTCAVAYEAQAYEIYNNRSLALRARGDYEKALADCEESIRLAPSVDLMALNRATILEDAGRTEEALHYLDDYVARRPEKINIAHNRSLILLNNAMFAEGWTAYDSRLLLPAANVHYEHFDVPRWQHGQPVAGKEILVWTEQGVGEEILTASMIPDLVKLGARVTLLCSEKLFQMLYWSLDGIAYVARRPSQLHVDMFKRQLLPPELVPAIIRERKFNYQMSQGDLGHLLRPTLASFPGTPFLKPDKEEVSLNKNCYLMPEFGKPKVPLVGISWHSKRNMNIGGLKSIDLKLWEPILRTPGVRFVNLQYGDCKADLAMIKEKFGVDVFTPMFDPLAEMTDYAALVACMDLVITVSNSAAHVAGGLGVPTWVMVPDGPGRLWYWYKGLATSPWYQNTSLYRQRRSSQWQDVMNQVAEDFRQWVETRTPSC